MRRKPLAALAFTALLAGCAAEPEERDFLLFAPDGQGPHDLILVFHGYGGEGESFSGVGLQGADALVVYADGEGQAWAGAPYAVTSMDEDVAYVDSIVERVREEHEVGRIFAAGFSNGGAFVHALDCQRPGLLTATATVAPAYYPGALAACEGAEHSPRLNLHGAHDDVIEPQGGERHGERYASSRKVTEAIGATGVPVEHRQFAGGHDWPVPEATEEILEFFEAGGAGFP